MELSGQMQKTCESLEDFALQIERLVQLAYPGESHPLLEQIKLRAFVSGIRDPDIRFTKKSRSFQWTEAQEDAFQKLKELLCTAPILGYPISGEKFELDTDASGYGIVGVFSQVINKQVIQ